MGYIYPRDCIHPRSSITTVNYDYYDAEGNSLYAKYQMGLTQDIVDREGVGAVYQYYCNNCADCWYQLYNFKTGNYSGYIPFGDFYPYLMGRYPTDAAEWSCIPQYATFPWSE